MIKKIFPIFIILFITVFIIVFFYSSQPRIKEHCIPKHWCIKITSDWNEIRPMRGENSIELLNGKNEEISILFLDPDRTKILESDFNVVKIYPWGRIAKFKLDSAIAKNFGNSDILSNMLFSPEWQAVIECTNFTCLDYINGFSRADKIQIN